MEKSLLFIPLIIVILISSGCTYMPAVIPSSGNGLVIESFAPDFPSVYSGEKIKLRLSVRNTGSDNAIIKSVELFGVEKNDILTDTCSDELMDRKMRPGDVLTGAPGEAKNCFFEIRAPGIPQGLPNTYEATVRIIYSYTSTAVKTVVVADADELRRLQDTGGIIPSESFTLTNGPIAIGVEAKSPVKVFDIDISFPIEVSISNQGGGSVFGSANAYSSANRNTISLEITGGIYGECVGTWKDISMISQNNKIMCTAYAPLSTESISKKEIIVHTGYAYLIEKPVSFQVTGAAK